MKSRTGVVTTPQSGGGAGCGPLTMTGPCPVDCVVNWGAWNRCSYSGVQTATGTISIAPQGTGRPCGSLTRSQSCTALPEFQGCYSSQNNNGTNVQTPISKGSMKVSGCNQAARNAQVPYFGMSYWQGSDPNNSGTNTGFANCVLPNAGATFDSVTNYTGAPGGNANNAPSCTGGPLFTKDCISLDTNKACVKNMDQDAPPGSLGGAWINAIYKTTTV